MPTGSKSFSVSSAGLTLQVSGDIFTLTPSGIPDGVTVKIGTTTLANDTPVQLTANQPLSVSIADVSFDVTVEYTNTAIPVIKMTI